MSNAPWSQLPRESAAAYQWFLAYRDLGARRSLEKVAAGVEPTDQNPTDSVPKPYRNQAIPKISQLKSHSSKFRWVERSLAWDQHLSAVRDAVLERHARVQAEREIARADQLWEASQKAYTRIIDALSMPMVEVVMEVDPDTGKPVKIVRPTKWRFGDLPAMIRSFVDLRDEATGHRTTGTPSFEEPTRQNQPMFVEVEPVQRPESPPEILNVEVE